ncbi:helix-turn-helix transcriptional regulator [Eubacterium barkeri]|uniref:CBS domain-containing protein n=1 Tax=Eubacterium barkeri TaxID=1528 RepID=A0A1H3BVS1_EUBBA|nr:CBS domain-containing protein [Eubacterium barkeri]
MELSKRQNRIIDIVKKHEPVKSTEIAEELGVNRATIRPDLKLLTMVGILEAKRKVGYQYTGRTLLHMTGSYIKTINIMDIQSEPTTVSEETTIYDGIITMFTKNAGTIYVVDGEYLSGIVSRKDFMKSMIGRKDIESLPIPIIMTRMPNIVYLEEDETVYDAAVKTMKYEVESLPIVRKVTDEKGRNRLQLIGKVSRTNITRYVVNLGQEDD